MALGTLIEDLVIGDDYDVRRTVTDIPEGATLTDGWLTVKLEKTDADEEAVFQLHITAIESADGIIDDAGGSSSGSGSLHFQMNATNTALLSSRVSYYYDIAVLTNTVKRHTVEGGQIYPKDQITTV